MGARTQRQNERGRAGRRGRWVHDTGAPLDCPAGTDIIITMTQGKPTMTELLRESLAAADSIRGVAKATGLRHSSLLRFVHGRQSLRLDCAERLADYFGIESRRTGRRED